MADWQTERRAREERFSGPGKFAAGTLLSVSPVVPDAMSPLNQPFNGGRYNCGQ